MVNFYTSVNDIVMLHSIAFLLAKDGMPLNVYTLYQQLWRNILAAVRLMRGHTWQLEHENTKLLLAFNLKPKQSGLAMQFTAQQVWRNTPAAGQCMCWLTGRSEAAQCGGSRTRS